MKNTVILQKNLIIFGLPILIIGLMILISKSSFFISNPNSLSIGITFDLLLTVPLIYFFLIRKTDIPKTSVVPFFIIGIVICSLIIPEENQYYLNTFKTWVLPIVEVTVFLFIYFKVKKTIKKYKINKRNSTDFFTNLKTTCNEILPKKLVIPFVTEFGVIYYGFIYWKKRKLKNNEFSYHKENGTIALLAVLILIIAIETIVLHLFIEKWSLIAAWALTGISIYSGIQIFGFLKSIIKRPISIENDLLYLRYGIMKESIINIKNIDSIEVSTKDFETNDESTRLSLLGELEGHNVIIHLTKPNTIKGLYGIKKEYKKIAIYIDNKQEFVNQIDNAKQIL